MPQTNLPQFRCDTSEPAGPLPHFWEHTVGSGHATLALRADWQAQLTRCQRDLGFRHVRFHAILSDSMGTLICNQDEPLYSFHNADLICDFLLSIGMKPFVELSFMPEMLSSGDKTVFHYRANVTPPKDYEKWAMLIEKLARHWVDRYGADEVRQWFFEVWNEPNLKAFWPASQAEYFKLYRFTARALKKVDGQIKVGGPATANNQWIDDFLNFCEKNDLPADFVSTHHYPTDALGTQSEDTEAQLAQVPRDILKQWAQDTRRKVGDRPLYYTEWNISSNPRDHLHDEPYAAAAIVKTMMDAVGLAQGYSFWTFSDIFSENYFPSKPFQGGFGLLTLESIAKPAYRAFQLLHQLGDQQLVVDGSHPTVQCWAAKNKSEITALLTNYALPRHPMQAEQIALHLKTDRAPQIVYLQRIDADHANPKSLWEAMGAPEYPSDSQVQRLHSASELQLVTPPWRFEDGTVRIELTLPVYSVAAITLEFSESSDGGRPQ